MRHPGKAFADESDRVRCPIVHKDGEPRRAATIDTKYSTS